MTMQMQTEIQIRKVTLCDVKFLVPLMGELGYPITEENLTARIALYQIGHNDIAWVATHNEKIIGCIALHIYDLFHCTERFGRIVSLVVNQAYRRQGVGKLLLKRVERYAKEKNCTVLELTSSLKRLKYGAHSFYDQLGYKNDGEYESRYLRKFLKPKEGPLL